MSEYMDYNTWLEKEVKQLEKVRDIKHNALKSADKRIKDLEYENEKLKSDINYQINQKHEYVIKNTQLKKEIDDFYYEQSKLKESDFYIKALKNQLFNAYLEIESDNVNIQLSHYHIKKLLKIIDEHTLINPYTN